MNIANEIRHFPANKIKMVELTAFQEEEEFFRATKCRRCGKK